MKNPLPMEASWWADFRWLFRMSKIVISMQPPYTNSLKYYKEFFMIGSVMMSRIQKFFRMWQGIIFKQLPYINFITYYEKSFNIGSVMMSRIQKKFQNFEVYYFYTAAIYQFSKILWKICYRWKRVNEQNSDHFLECRSLLFVCSRHILIL